MTRLARSEAQFFAKSHAAIHALGNLHMRTYRLIADIHDLEPAAAIVFLTVCLATKRPAEVIALGVSPAKRAVSRLAIAESTGLARETVRRKCAELVKAGLIESWGRKGVAAAPGRLLSEQDPAVLRQILADAHQTIEILFRLGIFAAGENASLAATG